MLQKHRAFDTYTPYRFNSFITTLPKSLLQDMGKKF